MSNEPTLADVERLTAAIEEGCKKLADHIAVLGKWVGNAAEDKRVKPADVGKGLFAIKNAHDQVDNQKKQLYKLKDWLDKSVMPQRLEDHDLDQIRIPEIARSFTPISKLSASFIDKEKGFAWLRERGAEDLIQETVNAGTLSAYVKNLQEEEGIDPPDDIVKVNMYYVTGINKYTPKNK